MAVRMKKLGWFVAIWALSVLALGLVGFVIRAVIVP
jgi:preprotein translocase subunit Sss1